MDHFGRWRDALVASSHGLTEIKASIRRESNCREISFNIAQVFDQTIRKQIFHLVRILFIVQPETFSIMMYSALPRFEEFAFHARTLGTGTLV